jgi:hypothetical protein
MFNLSGIEKIQFGKNNIKQTSTLMIKSENIKKLFDTLNRNRTIKYKIKYDTKDDNHRNILMSYDKEILFNFIVSKTTKMEKIIDNFTQQYGAGYKFYINDKKIKNSDSLENLGIKDNEVTIEILDEDDVTPKPSRTSSPKPSRTSSRKSPKTSGTSSPKPSRTSSPKPSRTSSRKSPKTSGTS